MITMKSSHRRVLSVLAWGWVATVWSTILSCRDNPAFVESRMFQFDPNVTETVRQYGGFPLRVFAYPQPPLGPGPYQSLVPFIANLIFWTIVALILARFLEKRLDRRSALALTVAATVTSTVVWFLYILMAFD